MDDEQILIEVLVAQRPNGPVFESIPARRHGPDRYQLLSSPGLALNLARGDIIEIVDPHAPASVVERGGNFCVQIYADALSAEDIERLERSVDAELRGTLDGIHGGNLALSIPADAGMARIAAVFDAFTRHTGVQWYFANVYKNFDDIDDDTLLDWWQ